MRTKRQTPCFESDSDNKTLQILKLTQSYTYTIFLSLNSCSMFCRCRCCCYYSLLLLFVVVLCCFSYGMQCIAFRCVKETKKKAFKIQSSRMKVLPFIEATRKSVMRKELEWKKKRTTKKRAEWNILKTLLQQVCWHVSFDHSIRTKWKCNEFRIVINFW